MISFILNNKSVRTDLPPGLTLLDYIRYHQHLKGTKIGCREGDCGACTVLVGKNVNGEMKYISMTSCLAPLVNINGCHVVTIEGVKGDSLTPVQEAVVEENGTQCGFCTVGFIMSLTGSCINETSEEGIIASMDGNICRCTGYKSLERAAGRIAGLLENYQGNEKISWLIKEGVLPDYFARIPERLNELQQNRAITSGKITGGGTDLYVQMHEEMVHENIQSVFNNYEYRYVREENGRIYIGGSTTVEDMKENILLNEHFPDLQKHLKLISSTPIRNMATLGGNFVNASPIGDMTIFFLALNAEITLSEKNKQRKISLKDFYKGYKTLDKTPDEMIEEISFQSLITSSYFNFEKVSKRTHLDIASVNAAISFNAVDQRMQHVHASLGGVFAYPKYLVNTAAFLEGKKITTVTVEEALSILQDEISPISDARGTKEYKRLLARQLFIAHFEKYFSEEEVLSLIVKL